MIIHCPCFFILRWIELSRFVHYRFYCANWKNSIKQSKVLEHFCTTRLFLNTIQSNTPKVEKQKIVEFSLTQAGRGSILNEI